MDKNHGWQHKNSINTKKEATQEDFVKESYKVQDTAFYGVTIKKLRHWTQFKPV